MKTNVCPGMVDYGSGGRSSYGDDENLFARIDESVRGRAGDARGLRHGQRVYASCHWRPAKTQGQEGSVRCPAPGRGAFAHGTHDDEALGRTRTEDQEA